MNQIFWDIFCLGRLQKTFIFFGGWVNDLFCDNFTKVGVNPLLSPAFDRNRLIRLQKASETKAKIHNGWWSNISGGSFEAFLTNLTRFPAKPTIS